MRVVLFTTDSGKNRIGSFMNISYSCDDIDQPYEELKRAALNLKPDQKNNPGAGSPSSKTLKETAS